MLEQHWELCTYSVCVCACVCARVCVCLCRECNSEHVYIVNIVVSLSYLSKHAG